MHKSLKDEKYKSWETALTNYIMSRRGVNNIPLAYVIQKIPRDTTIATSREIEIIYGTPLLGALFGSDYIEVYGIINQLTFEQSANK